jgi:hypothetical protein
MDLVASGEYWIIFDFDLISNLMFQLSYVPWFAIYESKDHSSISTLVYPALNQFSVFLQFTLQYLFCHVAFTNRLSF